MKKLLLAVVFIGACSGSQHPWTTDIQASLVVAAHTVDVLDEAAASAYTAAARDGGDIRALDAQLAERISIRREAASALISAQTAVATMVRDPSTRCAAMTAVRLAEVRLARVSEQAAATLAVVEAAGPRCGVR